jgi:hypothetical protein
MIIDVLHGRGLDLDSLLGIATLAVVDLVDNGGRFSYLGEVDV